MLLKSESSSKRRRWNAGYTTLRSETHVQIINALSKHRMQRSLELNKSGQAVSTAQLS